MFADNIVSYTENRRGREKSLEKWSNDLERRGMKQDHIHCHSEDARCRDQEWMSLNTWGQLFKALENAQCTRE